MKSGKAPGPLVPDFRGDAGRDLNQGLFPGSLIPLVAHALGWDGGGMERERRGGMTPVRSAQEGP